MCAIAAPEVFGSDEIGNAKVLITGEISALLHAKVRRAESNCPERAITIIELREHDRHTKTSQRYNN